MSQTFTQKSFEVKSENVAYSEEYITAEYKYKRTMVSEDDAGTRGNPQSKGTGETHGTNNEKRQSGAGRGKEQAL